MVGLLHILNCADTVRMQTKFFIVFHSYVIDSTFSLMCKLFYCQYGVNVLAQSNHVNTVFNALLCAGLAAKDNLK